MLILFRFSKAYLNPLQLDSDEERSLYEAGVNGNLVRDMERKESLLKNPPTETERAVIHDMFLRSVDAK